MTNNWLNSYLRQPRSRRSKWLFRYGITVLSVVSAVFAVHYLPVIGEWGRGALLIFFFANVLVTLWFGLYPALLASILSLGGINFYLLNSIWRSDPNDAVFINAGYCLLSIIIIALIHYYQRQNRILLESQQDLMLAQEVAQVGSWRFKAKENDLYWTDEKYRIFEIPVGMPITIDTFLAAIHPEDKDYVNRMWESSLRGEPYDVEHRIIVGGGKVKWIREKAILEFAKNGALLGGFGTTQDITQRKLAEQELRDREKKLQLIMDLSPNLVCYLDTEFKYVRINKSCESWWNIGMEQVLGHEVREIVGEQAWLEIKPYMEQARSGASVSFDYQSPSWRWVHVDYVPDIDSSGAVIGIVVNISNITEIKQAEQKLRDSEQRIRLAASATGAGIWEWNLSTDKVLWDKKMFELYGVPETEDGFVDYAVWRDSVLPDEIAQQEMLLNETILTIGYNRREFHIQRPDGTILLLEAVETVRVNDEGKPAWVVGTNLDVTEKRNAEIALKDRENQIRLIMNLTPALVSYLDTDLKYVRANKTYSDWYGISPKDMIGHSVREILADQTWEIAEPYLKKALSGETTGYEHLLSFPNNPSRWSKVIYVPDKDDTGIVKGLVVHVADITDQKNQELKLIEKENALKLIINAMPALVAYIGNDFRYVRANKTYEKWLGIPVEQVVGSEIKDIIGEAGWQKIKPYMERAMSGEEIHYDFMMPYKTGNARWIHVNYVPDIDSSGHVHGVVALVVDISEITEAQQEIKKLNDMLQNRVDELEAIFDAAPIGLSIAESPDGKHIRGNKTIEEMIGLSTDSELSLRNKETASYKVYRDGSELAVDKLPMQCAVRGIPVRGFVADILRPDGQIVSILSNAVPLYDNTGNPRGAVGAFLDITSLKNAELALIESEERLRLAQTAGALGIYDHNIVSGEVKWDKRILEIWGLEPNKQVKLSTFLANVHPDDSKRVKAIIKKSFDPKGSGEYHDEYRIIRPVDKRIVWVSTYGIVRFKDNRPYRLVGFIQDITDRKQSEIRLLETEARLSLALNELNAGYWDWNLETNDVFFSSEWKRQLGYSDSEVSNRYEEWENRLHPDDKPRSLEIIECFLSGELVSFELEFRLRHKDGTYRWIHSRAAFIQSPTKRLVGIHLDITNYKLAKEISQQRKKMEEAFQLTIASQTVAAIAHELNQPLSAISYFADVAVAMLNTGNKNPEKLAFILGRCSSQAQRAGEVIKQLMTVLEKGDIQFESIDINKMVDYAYDYILANHELNTSNIETNLASGLPMIKANKLQIQKIMINIIHNSLEAIHELGRDSGKVIVSTQVCPANPALAQVSVSDNGVGVIDIAALSKMFKPFYSTKETGLGMGLAISRALIEAHGGNMWAEQNADSGVTVHFTLPFAL